VDEGHHAVIAAFRRDTGPDSLGFLVVCNFDIFSTQHLTVDLGPLLETVGSVSCRELLSGETQILPNPTLDISLPPCTAQVLRCSVV
jgi:hypothetical protein